MNEQAIAAAVCKGLACGGVPVGGYGVEGVASVALSGALVVGVPTTARAVYRPDVAALCVHLAAQMGVTDAATVGALVTRALHHARVLPTCAAAADATTAALERYSRAVAETLPRVERSGPVSWRGDARLIGWDADASAALDRAFSNLEKNAHAP